jgi:DNA polymerase I
MFSVMDVESTTRTSFKRKANPFDKLNYVVAAGIGGPNDKPTAWYFGRTGPTPGWLAPYLGGKLVVGHNIKYDLHHALNDSTNLALWQDYVAQGGLVWDTQLAEYLLEGMTEENHYLSLDEVAVRYGGDVKVDEVKALWEAGVDTPDIEPALLLRYLLGGPDEQGIFREGDIGNTQKVFLAQLKRARECGQLPSILLNMGALCCTIEMERNGMFVENMLARDQARELSEQIGLAAAALQEFIPKDCPFPFKWSSPVQKSALIFGGSVKYPRREYDLANGTSTFTPPEGLDPTYLYASKEETHYLLPDGSTVEATQENLIKHGADLVFFASGKNAGTPKTKKVKVPDATKPKGRMAEDWYTFPGYTQPSRKWEGATPGVYSTSGEVIKELANRNIPFLKALASFSAMTKDLGTYYITFDEDGTAKGMLSLLDELGIIHHKINHTSTVTGRFSSSDPNLQNIPKGNKSQIKRAFMSRFGKYITDDFGDLVYVSNGKIIQSDFTALEIYIQALLTKCAQLIQDLKDGLDMHCARLATKLGMDYEEVLKLCKGYTDADGVWHDAVPEWDYKRTGAKVFSFQRAYGAGAEKIADSTGMPIEDVKALIEADNLRYPEIEPFFEGLSLELRQSRTPWRTVPHPEAAGVVCHLGRGYYRTPDQKLYAYTEHPAPEFVRNAKDPARRANQSFSPTEIKNYIVQGEGGEWAKAAMWLAVRAFYHHRNWGEKALLVNQVHDALYADAHNDFAFEAAAWLHACMEAASEFMEQRFKWEVPVPVPSDTTWGASMMEEERIPGVKARAAECRQWLRQHYMNNYQPSFEQ